MAASILFVSSNDTWGGSEVLWYEAAIHMVAQGYDIIVAVRYNNEFTGKLKEIGVCVIDLNQHAPYPKRSLFQRVKRKLGYLKIERPKEIFVQTLIDTQPQLVVISQGNNIGGNYFMSCCREMTVPFVTVTQLVTEILWVFIKDDLIDELRLNYATAKNNFFVSQANLNLHRLMLSDITSNAKVINNPFTVPFEISLKYPDVVNYFYRVALVGRLETYHKGQDLLIQVLAQEKWQKRPIKFTLYGSGPHEKLLKKHIKHYNLTNIEFAGHVKEVDEIWQKNHLLILPSRMEGQSLALIEAMWCHRGAIVTDVGGAAELITEGETGFIAELPTVESLVNALERAWEERNNWETIGLNAGVTIRKLYSKHPVKAFANEIIDVVNSF